MDFDEDMEGENEAVDADLKSTAEAVAEVTFKVDAGAELRRQMAFYFRGFDFSALVKSEVAKHVNAEVVLSIEGEVQKVIADTVRSAMADGWEKTDQYGRRQAGTKVQAKDLVIEYLTSKDSYSSSGTWMQRRAQELFNEVFRKEIDPLVAEAKKMFKEMLDSSLRDKLAGALRDALGLKG